MQKLFVEHLTKQYSARKTVIQNMNEIFVPGSWTGLVGPNGSGKTTFLRLVSLNSYPTSGQIRYGDLDIHKKPGRYLQHVGIVHDEESLPGELSAVELIRWVMSSRNQWTEKSEGLIRERFDRLQLDEQREERIKTYSTGMKKKVQIAAAFSVNPKILILDEPLRGLDRSSREEVLRMIRESTNRGAMVLMASHLFTEGTLQADRTLHFPINGEEERTQEERTQTQ